MLFLASPSLKEMFLENSLQREDVQIDFNTCSRARYLCEPDFHLFISSPRLPFRLLLYSDDGDAQHFGSWNTILLPNVDLLHHFVSLGCSLTQTGWLFSKCVLCILSPQGSAALSPHLEDCLCLVSNSSSQSLTPLGLRCPWIQARTQWQKPHGKVFIASFSGGMRLISKDWISCKVHSYKEGQERGWKWQVESLHTSRYLITSQSHAVQYIHVLPSGVLGKYPCQESPIRVICRFHHYEGTKTMCEWM